MTKIIEKAAAFYIICWTFLPFMQVEDVYRFIAIGCVFAWCFLIFAKHQKSLSKYSNIFVTEIAVVLVMILWRLFLGLSITSAIAQTLQLVIMILASVISIYYHENDTGFLKKIFPLLVLLILIFSITTIQGLVENPYASRIANSEWLEDRYKGNENVGLYGYIYMCVFLAPMFFYMIYSRIKIGKYIDLLLKITFVAMLGMIFMSGYMIAIFCTIGSCLFVWALWGKNPIKIFLILIGFLLFIFNYETIIQNIFSYLISKTSNNPVYYDKILDFQSLFLSGDVTGYTVEGRLSNYGDSWNNIMDYPLLGCYFVGKSGGGGHSAILDVFGRFGLIIGCLYMYIIGRLPHSIGNRIKKWNYIDYMLILMTIVFGLLDPFFQEMGIAIYLFFPLIKTFEAEKLNYTERYD